MSVGIIGAGPVGVKLGIEMKLKDPSLKVKIFEQYQSYKRHHIVRLAPKSIQNLISIPAFKTLHSQLSFNASIRTNDLENLLLQEARRLGIEIIYEKVQDPLQIPKRFPDIKHMIGADGAHSLCRKSVFENRYRFSKALQYAIQVKYEVIDTEPKRLSTEEILKLENRFGSFRPIEYIGKKKDNSTSVSLWVLVDKNIFDQMKEATFKTPYDLEKDKEKIPASLYTTIKNWMEARDNIRSLAPEKVSQVFLSSYASYFVTKKYDGVQWSLVGDAALGVPFYRSLNNGIISASWLAKAIIQDLNTLKEPVSFSQKTSDAIFNRVWKFIPSFFRGTDEQSSVPMKKYALRQNYLAYKEHTFAFFKTLAVKFLSYLLWLKRAINNWIEKMDMEPFYQAPA